MIPSKPSGTEINPEKTSHRRGLVYGFVLLLVTIVIQSCYTFSGSTLPPHLRTLFIIPIENQTLEPSLGDVISRAIEDGFRSRSNLRRVNENGDVELKAVLTRYSHTPQSSSGEKVTLFRVDMVLSVLFIDKVKGDTLYRESSVPGYASYSPDRGETEEQARRAAAENLVKVVLDNTVSAW